MDKLINVVDTECEIGHHAIWMCNESERERINMMSRNKKEKK